MFIALIAGIVLGAVGMAALNRHQPDVRPTAPASPSGQPHTEGKAVQRDLDEHAGGSRHIRTNPSWRDRHE
ncbi:hypothetical protein ACIP5Y_24650 [Nocardia sp. NPDC088792]|uniref:hypothetical protein n=1 Tax=Nocardia sp. NPDC088792 TaxID=3364332 RepID=UPI003830237B